MKKVTTTVTACWSIYDSWSELLYGTRFLLDVLNGQENDEIAKVNLLRLALVSSSQMTEVMLFAQLKSYVESQSETVKKLFEYDLKKRISFSEARAKWPAMLTGKELDIGSEPMQSMQILYEQRSAAIHHTAKCPVIDIGESAFYTAIEASKYIYNYFNSGGWDRSEYKKFVDNHRPKTKTLLRKAIRE